MPRQGRDELDEAPRAAHEDTHNPQNRDRLRSRSPRRRPVAQDFHRERAPERRASHDHHDRHPRHRHRSRHPARGSPAPGEGSKRHSRHHDPHLRHKHAAAAAALRETRAELPFNARPLSYKGDRDAFTHLFAYYLDVQKSLDLDELSPHEARGRWKSFVNKWNRGELAEGWYDPEMFERITRDAPPLAGTASHDDGADDDAAGRHDAPPGHGASELRGDPTPPGGEHQDPQDANDEDGDDGYGPPPPPPPQQQIGPSLGGTRKGPGIPTLADLALQREAAAEARGGQAGSLREARRADRAQQKERLDELVPRAEPGTRERRLEKRALVSDKMAALRDRGVGAMEEVGDGELMGGGDSLAELRRAKAASQRKKTERELRREAEARAREEERLGRLREWREREEEKLRGLKELARARFG